MFEDMVKDGYNPVGGDAFTTSASFIYYCFNFEILEHDRRYKAGRISEFDLFNYWVQGLPSAFDASFMLGRAVDDLGEILEETETEKNRYTQEQAEKLLTVLIFREIKKRAIL